MRIHLNLPSARSAAEASTPLSHDLVSSAPTPLTALTPNGELILIELQGSLEIENQSEAGGQTLGTISFEPTRPDRPVLMISHHRLEGEFMNLVKPLAVLERKVREDKTKPVLIESSGANGKRRAEQQEGEEEGSGTAGKVRRGSSPRGERRGRDALDFSSSPPRPAPSRASAVAKGSDLKNIDENHDENGAQNAEQGDKEEDDEEAEEHQTAVYYDVVSVIKRKILFSKRPEPIVRLDSATKA